MHEIRVLLSRTTIAERNRNVLVFTQLATILQFKKCATKKILFFYFFAIKFVFFVFLYILLYFCIYFCIFVYILQFFAIVVRLPPLFFKDTFICIDSLISTNCKFMNNSILFEVSNDNFEIVFLCIYIIYIKQIYTGSGKQIKFINLETLSDLLQRPAMNY